MTQRQPTATGCGPGTQGTDDPLFVHAVLRLYPPPWRERYGEEFACLLTDMTASSSRADRIKLIADAANGALRAHLHPLGSTSTRGRIRTSLATVACAAMAFAIAVLGVGKMKEGSAYGRAAHAHAVVAASAGVLRGAAIAAGITVTAAAVPLAWSVVRQAVATRRADLIRPLATGPAAVAGWLAIAWITARSHRHAQSQSGPDMTAVTVIVLLGAAAAAACAWAAVVLLRRADLAPRLLRAEILPMGVLSACMALATGADIGWGISIWRTDQALFRSGSDGLLATPLAPSWAGSALVLAGVTAVAAAATVRAVRQLRTIAERTDHPNPDPY